MEKITYAIILIFSIFTHILIQLSNAATDDTNIFSIISDTVLERQTEHQFHDDDQNSNVTDITRIFQQYLFAVSEETDKNKIDTPLHLRPIYVNIFDKDDNIRFHRIICNVSQFEKLKHENQIIIANRNMNAIIIRYEGVTPWFVLEGLAQIDDANYNFIFNITKPVLREEFEMAKNNAQKMKIKSKLEVFSFDNFILSVELNKTENEYTNTSKNEIEIPLQRQNSTSTYPVNGTNVTDVSTEPKTNDTSFDVRSTNVSYTNTSTNITSIISSTTNNNDTLRITGPHVTIQRRLKQVQSPNMKLLQRLADTWLIDIIAYINQEYVEPSINDVSKLFTRQYVNDLLDQMCHKILPDLIEISDLSDTNVLQEDWNQYENYTFSQIKMNNLIKFVKCYGIGYPKKINTNQCLQKNSTEHKVELFYEYSSLNKSSFNWKLFKKGRQKYSRYSYPYRDEYYPDSAEENSEYIRSMIIKLWISTNMNGNLTDDPVKVEVQFESSTLENVTQDKYRKILLPRVMENLTNNVKSRIKI